MSVVQNLSYTVVQVLYNFGAVAIVGGSLSAISFRSVRTRRNLAVLTLSGWGVQTTSGMAFGGISYYFYHRFPDISGIAVDALVIKMVCAAIGILLLVTYLLQSKHRSETRINAVWQTSSVLSVIALSAAAFLRWFS